MANYSFYSQFDNQTNRPSNKQPQIALFIDAENVPAQHMDDVMATLQQQGEIVIKVSMPTGASHKCKAGVMRLCYMV